MCMQVSGAIAGLVVATPGSGYMDQNGAIVSGLTSGPVCYVGIQLKHWLGYVCNMSHVSYTYDTPCLLCRHPAQALARVCM